jgi:serine/threonine protein kinase
MWALGVVLLLLLRNPQHEDALPWHARRGPDPALPLRQWPRGTDLAYRYILAGQLAMLPLVAGLSAPAVELLQALLQRDPARRPTAAQLRAFEWFRRRGEPPSL